MEREERMSLSAKIVPIIIAAAVALAPSIAEAKKRPKPREPDIKPPVITHVRVTKAPRNKALTIRARFEPKPLYDPSNLKVKA